MKRLIWLLLAMSFVMTMVTVVINAALAKRTTTSTGNPAPTPPPIVSISVCSSDSKSGTLDQGSCGTGLFDTHQIVRSPEGISINEYVQGGVSDEHQSIFAPG